MVEETRGKCYSEPVTPVVFKNGCDDWYLEYMILMRVINQTMVWEMHLYLQPMDEGLLL